MRWARAGAVAMALAVACGAFGAHGLEARLTPEALEWWSTAARYHAWHGLGLFAVAWMSDRAAHPRRVSIAGWGLCIGLVLFSGSLYLMALTGHRWLGAITPLGGTAWIVAWIVLAGAARKAPQ